MKYNFYYPVAEEMLCWLGRELPKLKQKGLSRKEANYEKQIKFAVQKALSSNSQKKTLWTFILVEEFLRDKKTIKTKLTELDLLGMSISRATYYREINAFINAVADILFPDAFYLSEKPSKKILKSEKIGCVDKTHFDFLLSSAS